MSQVGCYLPVHPVKSWLETILGAALHTGDRNLLQCIYQAGEHLGLLHVVSLDEDGFVGEVKWFEDGCEYLETFDKEVMLEQLNSDPDFLTERKDMQTMMHEWFVANRAKSP